MNIPMSANTQPQQQITTQANPSNSMETAIGTQSSIGNAGEISKVQDAQPAKPAVRDQYTPSKMPAASCGLYRPVMDGNGAIKIQFDKPNMRTKKETVSQVSDTQEVGENGQEAVVQKQNEPSAPEQSADQAIQGEQKGELAEKKVDSKSSNPTTEQSSDGAKKIQELKKKKKQLQQKIQSTADEGKASELRKKLAQVEHALKTAKK